MKKQQLIKVLCAFIIIVAVIFNTLYVLADGEKQNESTDTNTDLSNNSSASVIESDYFAYYNSHIEDFAATDQIVLDQNSVLCPENITAQYKTADTESGLVMDGSCSWYEWKVSVPQDARYAIYVHYYPLKDTDKDILFSCMVDGKYPYSESTSFSLPRLWQDETGGSFEVDKQGNDMRPKQIEKPAWTTYAVQDVVGLYDEPYFIGLTAGTHTLRFSMVREKMLLGNITLKNKEEVVSYNDYYAQFSEKEHIAGKIVLQQAENSFEKNSSTLYPVYDRTTPATQPCDYATIRLNTIGKENWSSCGTSISWKVDVPKEGLYRLAFRARQNMNQGMNSYRTLFINGKIPFKEAENIVFPYNDSWYIKVLGDDSPQYVYLKKGDIITLTVSAGPMSFALREIKQSILKLNQLYRKIILITGLSPDMYQDYNLEDRIPELCGDLSAVSEDLKNVSANIEKQLSQSGALLSTLKRSIKIYDELVNDPYTIPERLSNYKDSIENLGSLILSLGSQPLELDYFALIPKGNDVPKADASFFDKVKYSIMKFISSFSDDYATVNNKVEKDELSVWVATGRDQMQILNQMINSDFTDKHNAIIHLNMVDTGATLIKAALAGKGPDVALMIPEITPVNLAMRGELVALNNQKYNIDDIYSQFPEAAWAPFYYQNGLYALPETMVFDVLFYRTDIFEELNIEPPETWEDFYKVLKVIQSNNLLVAVPEINSATAGVSASIGMFDKFLLQNGGTYYTEDNSKTAFDNKVAINAFEKWSELYTVYGLDRDISFYNRFRSGEAVMGIMPYTQYNLLAAGALELDGLWAFAPVPGTKSADGSINRAQTANVTACIMLSSAVKRGVDDIAFEFMKWWVSADSQTQYGRSLEASLGVAARYTPANMNALENMGWEQKELSVLKEQMTAAKNVPQIPGNYVVPRALTSALRASIAGTYTPSRAISIWNKDINNEIHRKRVEFELE